MRGIDHIKLELGGLSVRHLRNPQESSMGGRIIEIQLKRNHHMCVFTKTFSVLMPLLFLFHIWKDQGQAHEGEEKYIMLEKNRVEFSRPVQFLSSRSIVQCRLSGLS